MNNEFDVVVVGYGPTGMVAAALLGQAGHRVLVVERWQSLYGLPRFTHIDDETARNLQNVCDIKAALADSNPTYYEWVNGQDELLLTIPTANGDLGYPTDLSIYQPDVENALDRRVKSLPNVTIRQGWAFVGMAQAESGVLLDLAPWTKNGADHSELVQVSADYVIGADGSRSTVRDLLGTGQADQGFKETWINIDTEWLRPRDQKFQITKQFCDPKRGHMFMGIGRNRQRFEFAVLEGEDPEDWRTPEAGWAWLEDTHGLGPSDLRVVRHLAYTFVGRVTDDWRRERVFLAGDAAHVMPPYLGQGACSGIRDAVNLAWKLDLVLRGLSTSELLDTYQEERKPYADVTVRASVDLGRIANTTDPNAAEARDEAFRTGAAPKPEALPPLSGEALRTDALSGTISPQGQLRRAGQRPRPGDEILGNGFRLILAAGAAEKVDDAAWKIIDLLKGTILALDGSIEDVEGTYSRYLQSNGVDAVLVRPDHIVYGTCRADDVSQLVHGLADQILNKNAIGREVRA